MLITPGTRCFVCRCLRHHRTFCHDVILRHSSLPPGDCAALQPTHSLSVELLTSQGHRPPLIFRDCFPGAKMCWLEFSENMFQQKIIYFNFKHAFFYVLIPRTFTHAKNLNYYNCVIRKTKLKVYKYMSMWVYMCVYISTATQLKCKLIR